MKRTLLHRLLSVLVPTAVLAIALHAGAQVSSPDQPRGLAKQLQRLDLGVEAVGTFNSNVSGPVQPKDAANSGQIVTDAPSNTVGVLVNIRYIARPYVGFEFNGGYARYTENFSNQGSAPSVGGVQTNADEFTLGYLVTPPHPLFGFDPYASIGTGVMELKPTPGGGQNLQTQARQAYYYSVGLQKSDLFRHVGVRVGFRQVLFLAPDYGQNYLTILKHTVTSEPMIGFYLHY